jgi:flagellar hook assembly protein FlgD
MHFVFTLTGSKVPDDILVRIMTVTGKVVREIRSAEFGPMHVGNNVSDFAWDGTDMYGDRLANGVYLYRVLTRIDGNEIEHRQSGAKAEENYFIENTGKIYMIK